MTTTSQVDHGSTPVLYHLGRDPGEKYPIGKESDEYKTVTPALLKIAQKHKDTLVKGKPQLNWCDDSVMVSYSIALSALPFR